MKKITRIEHIINKDEYRIMRINFYHYQERLVKVGYSDHYVNERAGRVEVFDIAEDEQLIGCEMEYCKRYYWGITWWKIKTRDWASILNTLFLNLPYNIKKIS